MNTRAVRYHDISCGHRVVGHESKCAHLHGHNYRIHFHVECATGLDALGRVMDFSVIKYRLCDWLENEWDHHFIYWEDDPVMCNLHTWVDEGTEPNDPDWTKASNSFVIVGFNPTAENMAEHLLTVVGPAQLAGTGVTLVGVRVEETRKCSVEVWL